MPDPRTVALIVAAGEGKRLGGPVPKQYLPLAGTPILARTIQAFIEHSRIDAVKVVIAEGYSADYEKVTQPLISEKLLPWTTGGATRQASVRLGLEALEDLSPDYVLVHDAARPFVSRDLIEKCIAELKEVQSVFAAVPVTDTLRKIESGAAETVSRHGLWRAQTPQGFHFKDILSAHRSASKLNLTDDIAVAETANLHISVVEDTMENFKITTAEDLAMAEAKLSGGGLITRSGLGYDVHRFERGRPMMLCGVHIKESPLGLKGHSDADVALHALTDAMLGAVGAGDIGEHFPPDDEKWKGAPSEIFIAGALKEIASRGGRLVNADITIICEVPKIGPHRAAMRARVAQLLEIAEDAINIKATTTEGLGFAGREEGIAAQAIVSIAVPTKAD